jgi:hypothetical protein
MQPEFEPSFSQGDPAQWVHPEYAAPTARIATSLAEYLLANYSCRQIMALFAGFAEHDSWERLSPAVLGAPAGELEAGWRAFLRSRDNGAADVSSKTRRHGNCVLVE